MRQAKKRGPWILQFKLCPGLQQLILQNATVHIPPKRLNPGHRLFKDKIHASIRFMQETHHLLDFIKSPKVLAVFLGFGWSCFESCASSRSFILSSLSSFLARLIFGLKCSDSIWWRSDSLSLSLFAISSCRRPSFSLALLTIEPNSLTSMSIGSSACSLSGLTTILTLFW